MKNRALYSLIPLAVLVGCSTMHHGSDDKGHPATSSRSYAGTTLKCFERDQCRITVVVTACSATGITANPDTLKVAKRLRNVPIVWTLRAPAGFTFAPDGVNFKNKELASRQFVASKASSHDYVWEDRNSEPGTFPYNIRVKNEGRDCPMHDPIIINDGTDSP